MGIFILITLTLSLCMLFGILLHGFHHVMESQKVPTARPCDVSRIDQSNFRFDVIVPVTGDSPELKDNLYSLMNQDFPQYRIFLVTRDHRDPAVPLIKELLKGHHHARHVVAGRAVRCGQKNFNLLAGIEAAGKSDGIFIFCDSSHHAPSTLFADLVRPILNGNEAMTTGFHRVVPEDSRPGTLGMMISVMAIHLLQGNAAFTQPWGGATAVRRSLFVDYGIDRLWSKTVVDDFTMGPYLRKQGIRCKPVSSACLTTPLAGEKINGWINWLTRQLLYMKYYTRMEWAAASIAAYLLVVPMLLTVVSLTGFFFDLFPSYIVVSCITYFVIMTATGIFIRRKFLKKSPIFGWLSTYFIAHFVVCWCYIRTWFLNTISWRGISYKMAWNGTVREVISDRIHH